MLSRLIGQKLVVPILLAVGILTTLLREIVFAKYLGVSRELEVFRVAFAFPNMLSQSLAPAYIGALLPALVAATNTSPSDYEAFRRRAARITVSGVAVITAIGMATVHWQATFMAPGFDSTASAALRTSLAMCWGFFCLTALSFLPRLYLNNRRVFWPGSSTSAVISVCLIVACTIALPETSHGPALVLATAAIASGVIILAMHVAAEPQAINTIAVGKTGKPGSAADYGKGQAAILGPLMLVLLIHCVNAAPRFVDRAVASGIAPGVLAAVDYSFNILTVPGILLGTSVITVFYPDFVQRVKNPRIADLDARISLPVVGVISLALIGGVVTSAIADDIVQLVYARGAFGAEAELVTSTLLGWHSIGLGFMVATMILAQACIAYGVFRYLLLIAVLRLGAKFLAVHLLVPAYGIDGLGASFIVPEAISTVLLAGLLFKLCRREPGIP